MIFSEQYSELFRPPLSMAARFLQKIIEQGPFGDDGKVFAPKHPYSLDVSPLKFLVPCRRGGQERKVPPRSMKDRRETHPGKASSLRYARRRTSDRREKQLPGADLLLLPDWLLSGDSINTHSATPPKEWHGAE